MTNGANLRSFIEQSLDGIVLVDEEGKITEWNPAQEKITGLLRPEAVGEFNWDVVYRLLPPEARTPEMYERIKQGTLLMLKTGKGTWLDGPSDQVTQTISGDVRTIQYLYFTIQTDRGYNIGSISRDVTDARRAVDLLKISEARYRELFDRVPVGLYQTTPEGQVIAWNRAMIDILGYTEDDAQKGISADEVYADSSKRAEWMDRVEREGVVVDHETQWRRVDGEIIWVKENARAVRDEDGAVEYYEGAAEDITAQKQAARELRESQARYRSIFENSPISHWEEDYSELKDYLDSLPVTDAGELDLYLKEHPEVVWEGAKRIRVLDVNQASLDLYKAKNQHELMEKLHESFREDDGDRMRKEFVALAEGSTNFENLVFHRTLTGERIDARVNVLVAPGYEEDWSRVIVSVVDITEQKKAEEELRYHAAFERIITELSTRFINISAGEVDQEIDQALKKVGEFAGVDRAYVFLFHADQVTMDNTHEWCAEGIEPQIDNLKGVVIGAELPWFAERIRRQEVVHIPCVSDLAPQAHLEQAHFQAQDIQSLVAVPLVSGGLLLGLLGFDAVREERSWSEELVSLLKMVGGIFANALEHRRIEETERRQQALERALSDTAAALTGTLELDEVLDGILDNIGQVVPHDAASIVLFDPGSWVVTRARYSEGYGDAAEDTFISLYRNITSTHSGIIQSLESGTPLLTADSRDDPNWQSLPQTDWVRSCVNVPVGGKGRAVGLLSVDSAAPHFFNQQHARWLQLFADQAAAAIENARLFEETQRRAVEAETLRQAAAAVAATLDLDEIIERILEQLAQVVPHHNSAVHLLRGGEAEIVSWRG